MAAKKETKDKKIEKPAVITKNKKKAKKEVPQKLSGNVTEQKFFAIDLVKKMGISSFDFLLIKREAGINDGSALTRSEMQNLYNKIIIGR